MNAFIAMTRKEFMESLRTYRLVIFLAVFGLFGMMSPLLAKLTPELLKSLGDAGMTITMADPTAMDAWVQFFKNVGQMGMLVLVIVFCGIMAGEFTRGTLVNLLTKGMKRRTVVLAKFLTASVLWAASYLLCVALCYVYTVYLWPVNELSHAGWAFLAPWLFGELMIALLIFGGVLFRSISGALCSCGGVVIGLGLVSIVPSVQKYNPIILAGDTLNLLNGQKGLAEYVPALVICAAAVIALVMASIAVFSKKQL